MDLPNTDVKVELGEGFVRLFRGEKSITCKDEALTDYDIITTDGDYLFASLANDNQLSIKTETEGIVVDIFGLEELINTFAVWYEDLEE